MSLTNLEQMLLKIKKKRNYQIQKILRVNISVTSRVNDHLLLRIRDLAVYKNKRVSQMAVMKNNKKILIDLFIKIYIMRNQSR
jgi:hypothetical protein